MMRDIDPIIYSGLQVDGLSKTFGDTVALDQITFRVASGELLAITGPSGAGKSTLGRLLSGLEQADAGRAILRGDLLTAMPPQARGVAHMFESYALYPTRSVFDNIASPLRAPVQRGRFSAEQLAARVEEVMHMTEIASLRDRLPAQLSGGQKQRVALCRTLVQDPSLFILDEPIGHLDAKLKHKLRGDIRRRQRALEQPTLWMTPDAVEAMAIADRVLILIGGRIQQIGTPEEIFLKPANVQVARLVGDPAMNVIPEALFADASGNQRLVGFRPTDILVLPAGAPDTQLSGEIYTVEPFGKYTLLTVSVAPSPSVPRIVCKLTGERNLAATSLRVGDKVAMRVAPDQRLYFDPGLGNLLP